MTWDVFCIETVWERDRNLSALPTLEMLRNYCGLKFVIRSAVTRDEFFRHLRVWDDSDAGEYPILYLGYHGAAGEIWLDGDEEDAVENRVKVADIVDGIRQSCENCVIHFGSCGTIDEGHAKELFDARHASGVSGFRHDVDWIDSAAFELMYLGLLQDVKSQDPRVRWLRRKRVMECRRRLRAKPYGAMAQRLGFELLAGDK